MIMKFENTTAQKTSINKTPKHHMETLKMILDRSLLVIGRVVSM